jgi:dienelactone hydrolase
MAEPFSSAPPTLRRGLVEQTRVRFPSGGKSCVGYLFDDGSVHVSKPCVVMGTGFGGTQDTPSIEAAARAFAAGGICALTFDYRNFGESDGHPRQVIDLEGQLEDFHSAVRFVRAIPVIDWKRVALWGTSLGGGHVVVVAARDPEIAAVVAQIPFNGFPREVDGRGWLGSMRLLNAMVRDSFRGWRGKTPYYVPTVGTPQERAVMFTPDAREAISGMTSAHWRNEIAPRALFALMRYKPSDAARRVRVPLLACIAKGDRETPLELAREIVEEAPCGEAREYPVAHFDFYRPEIREHVIVDQLAFLTKHLGPEH